MRKGDERKEGEMSDKVDSKKLNTIYFVGNPINTDSDGKRQSLRKEVPHTLPVRFGSSNEIVKSQREDLSAKRTPRKTIAAPLKVQVFQGIEYDCYLVDISQCGLRIRGSVAAEEGQVVGIHLCVPKCLENQPGDAFEQVYLVLICRVIWKKFLENGKKGRIPDIYAGLQIEQIDPEHQKHFLSYFEKLPPSEEAIQARA